MCFLQINNGEYAEALHLANRFELDSDRVYQHQWRKTEPTKANIDSLLHKVKNKSWVLQECLQKLGNDVSILDCVYLRGFSHARKLAEGARST